jgi:hypothetical protein
MGYLDSNLDGQINAGDDINTDDLNMMMEYCDFNGDGTLNACEIHDCIVEYENTWRAENCPGYTELYCEAPFECVTCAGAWSCEDIYNISVEVMALDTNNDGQINYGDAIESEHLEILVEYCDYNQNGSLDACEIHTCLVACENEWRIENCPANYG